jgi:hypothetical protein
MCIGGVDGNYSDTHRRVNMKVFDTLSKNLLVTPPIGSKELIQTPSMRSKGLRKVFYADGKGVE